MIGRLCWRAPSSDISARIPPSPSLSTRITKVAYLTAVITINVQITSDTSPSVSAGDGCPPANSITVLNVYSGLVPISPNPPPSAVSASGPIGFAAIPVCILAGAVASMPPPQIVMPRGSSETPPIFWESRHVLHPARPHATALACDKTVRKRKEGHRRLAIPRRRRGGRGHPRGRRQRLRRRRRHSPR